MTEHKQSEWQSGWEAGHAAALGKAAELLVGRMFNPYASKVRRDEAGSLLRELITEMEDNHDE